MSLLRADSVAIPLADASVDLIVTSPPYFALRSYTDGGEHYLGQIGSEPTPAEFLAALWAVTAECVRVLKPSGSLSVNLGDSYMGSGGHNNKGIGAKEGRGPKSYGWSGRGRGTDGTEPDWTEANAAWMAGVIDSDGSISVHINKQKEGNAPSFVPWVRIGQVTPEAVHEAHRITGTGRVFQDGRGVWNWNASAQQTGYVLERVWPYLRIKQRQALAAIELCRTIREYGASGGRKLGSDEIAYRQRIRDAVLGWNGGDPTGWEPPRVAKLALPQHSQWKPKAKSLMGLPWRYAIGCIDDLGLILRSEVIWSKPNGLPESVTDRVRRSHEQWFHFTKEPRYFSAVDEIREGYEHPESPTARRGPSGPNRGTVVGRKHDDGGAVGNFNHSPLGKLPGSVWTVPTEPLRVPDHLGVDHFAAFPSEWPRRLILGWSPSGVCVECGAGRMPVRRVRRNRGDNNPASRDGSRSHSTIDIHDLADDPVRITGYACDCPDTTAPTRPSVILDPFCGTGTTVAVANALGRHGIGLDLSADYLKVARWRCSDQKLRAKVLRVDPPAPQVAGQLDLLDGAA